MSTTWISRKLFEHPFNGVGVYLGFRLNPEGLDRAVQAAGVNDSRGYTVGIKDPSG